MERRRAGWRAPANPYQSGALKKYADQVGPARYGAVTVVYKTDDEQFFICLNFAKPIPRGPLSPRACRLGQVKGR